MLWLNNRTPYASVGVEPCRRPTPKPKGYGLFHVLTFVMTRLVSRYTLWNMLMSASIKMIVHTITFNQFNTHYLVIFQIMAFIRLMLAAFAGVECVAKQTGNWRDRREITRGFEPRKGELKIAELPQ